MTDFTDPYVDTTAGILHNLVGAQTPRALASAEGVLVASRLTQLAERYPAETTGDLRELRSIHRHLFQDVYAWAGELRTVDITKGTSTFVPVGLLDRAAGFAFAELAADDWLRGLDRETVVDRLAHHYDQINHLHPFREGNGRTQRIFWSRIARDAGWPLDWRLTSREVNDRASADAPAGLREMFDAIVSPAHQPPRGRFRLISQASTWDGPPVA